MQKSCFSTSTKMFAIAAGMLLSCGWLMVSGSSASIVSASTAGNAANGKVLFEKRCTGCHALDREKEGPRLGNVYGRRAGTVSGFQYSDALKAANITWDAAKLDQWLTDPDHLVPDNDMAFHVPAAQERADIIEYLRVSAGK